MRLVLLPVLILPALLAACSSEPPPAAAASSSSSSAEAPAATTGTPAAAEALAPLFGTWALDPAKCDGPVLKISQARFEGAENGCDITDFTDAGDGAFTAALSCTGEGRTVAEQVVMRPIFAPTGEGIELTYVNRDNLHTTVLRCPAPAGN